MISLSLRLLNPVLSALCFTPEHGRELARAFYGVSCWASAFDNDIWHRSLVLALRLDPELQPERFVSRCLELAVGTWRSEQALRHARMLKQQLRRNLKPPPQ